MTNGPWCTETSCGQRQVCRMGLVQGRVRVCIAVGVFSEVLEGHGGAQAHLLVG